MCWLTGIVVVEKIPVLRQNSIRLRFQQLKYDVHHADVATDLRGNGSSIPTRDQRACEGERRRRSGAQPELPRCESVPTRPVNCRVDSCLSAMDKAWFGR